MVCFHPAGQDSTMLVKAGHTLLRGRTGPQASARGEVQASGGTDEPLFSSSQGPLRA